MPFGYNPALTNYLFFCVYQRLDQRLDLVRIPFSVAYCRTYHVAFGVDKAVFTVVAVLRQLRLALEKRANGCAAWWGELLQLRDNLKAEVDRERRAEKVRQGLGNPGVTRVRFI